MKSVLGCLLEKPLKDCLNHRTGGQLLILCVKALQIIEVIHDLNFALARDNKVQKARSSSIGFYLILVCFHVLDNYALDGANLHLAPGTQIHTEDVILRIMTCTELIPGNTFTGKPHQKYAQSSGSYTYCCSQEI